mgnify:CR=1 FL=1
MYYITSVPFSFRTDFQSQGNMWKGFEDKVTHPQYNGDVKNGARIVREL